ncbi:MAG: metal-dependent hydrolase [Candidatus Thorarchaeota archaeon]|jgi:hypothetical protein
MPDVLTHLLVGASVALLVQRDDKRPEQMLIVLGALLIDIERPITWLIAGTELEWLALSPAFHSILGAIVLSYVAATCFVMDGTSFKYRFSLVLLGCSSHLMLDLTMYPWVEVGLFLLYPLQIPFSFNLLWPDFWWYPLFGATILVLTISLRYLNHHLKEVYIE